MQKPAIPKVLVVEDEEIINLFIRNELEDAGFGVELASSVKEARTKLREATTRFEAAVVDLRLPDEPGQLFVQELRTLQPELPIVIETGLTADEMAEGIDEGPTLRALQKPFAGSELLRALAAVGVHPHMRIM